MNEVADGLDCRCERTHLTRRRLANGTFAFYMQCLRCGRATSAAVAKGEAEKMSRRMGLASAEQLAPWNEAIGAAYEARRKEWVEARRLEQMARREDADIERTERYQAYLKTPDWRRIRDQVIERAGGLCEGCREATATEVHHLTYRHVFAEFLFELVALCRDCHQRVHA
jgi:hypothetical protein